MPVDGIRTMSRAQYDPTPVNAALLQPVLDGITKYFGTKAVSPDDLLWKL